MRTVFAMVRTPILTRCKQLTEHGEERCIKLREELDMLSEHPIS